MDNVLHRAAPLAIVGGLLAFAAFVVSMASPGVHRVPLPSQSLTPSPGRSGSTPSASSTHLRAGSSGLHSLGIPAWVQPLLVIIGGLVLVLIVVFMIWRFISSMVNIRAARLAHGAQPAQRTRREAVLEVVDTSIAELARDDGDPRSAVIICWVRLEELSTVAGVVRGRGDVPADLVRSLMSAYHVSADVLDTLANLYRTARYSPATVDPSMRREARRSLLRLRAEVKGGQM